jgi:molecular chaperone DnaK (HSP70)
LFDCIENLVQEAFDKAGIEISEISLVELVGGSSQIPLFKKKRILFFKTKFHNL